MVECAVAERFLARWNDYSTSTRGQYIAFRMRKPFYTHIFPCNHEEKCRKYKKYINGNLILPLPKCLHPAAAERISRTMSARWCESPKRAGNFHTS